MEKLKGEEADILEALMAVLKGTGFMSTSSTRALYFKPYGCCQSQAALLGELLQDVVRTVQWFSANL